MPPRYLGCKPTSAHGPSLALHTVSARYFGQLFRSLSTVLGGDDNSHLARRCVENSGFSASPHALARHDRHPGVCFRSEGLASSRAAELPPLRREAGSINHKCPSVKCDESARGYVLTCLSHLASHQSSKTCERVAAACFHNTSELERLVVAKSWSLLV